MNKEKITFRESSGNVFADFGLEDADDLMAKAELALAIRKRIKQRGLNQTQAAELIGTTQARVSELYNAKVMKMTFDRLLGFLNALECDTYITVTEHGADVSEKPGRIIVGGQEDDINYDTHDGSHMSLQIKDGRARWTERLGPASPAEIYDFDPKRVIEIMKMFRDRSQKFLDNSPTTTMFGDDTQRLSAGDCAYIATILKKAVEEAQGAPEDPSQAPPRLLDADTQRAAF